MMAQTSGFAGGPGWLQKVSSATPHEQNPPHAGSQRAGVTIGGRGRVATLVLKGLSQSGYGSIMTHFILLDTEVNWPRKR